MTQEISGLKKSGIGHVACFLSTLTIIGWILFELTPSISYSLADIIGIFRGYPLGSLKLTGLVLGILISLGITYLYNREGRIPHPPKEIRATPKRSRAKADHKPKSAMPHFSCPKQQEKKRERKPSPPKYGEYIPPQYGYPLNQSPQPPQVAPPIHDDSRYLTEEGE